jgi:hypothetical protein
VTEPIFTMAKADYRMTYLFLSDLNKGWLDMHALVMQWFGLLVLLSSMTILVISIRNRTPWYAIVVCASLMYPLFVVYGDGYYEFEKHVFPVLFLVVVFSMALLFMGHSRLAPGSARIQGALDGRVAEDTGLRAGTGDRNE